MIRSTQTGLVTVITIDRHEQRNALNSEHVEGLLTAVEAARDSGSRCVVITGAGTSFCAGADLDTVKDAPFRDRLVHTLRTICDLPIPVLAAVNGPAIGAGAQLAIACDLRVADPSARFMIPTAKLGVAADQWSSRRLATLAVGAARAMLMAAEPVTATRAHGLGLVDRIGSVDDALAWAQEICALAPLSAAYSKLVLNAIAENREDDPAIEAARLACWDSADAQEALRARAQRRAAEFTGR